MWVTALLGMTTSFVETTLAQMYKQRNTDGTYRGGGIYYISNGLRIRWLAVLMAVAVALGSGMADCMSHINGIYESLNSVFPCNPWIVGALLSLSAGAIIYGGFRRAAAFSEMVVPFMAVAYILVSLFIVISNLPLLPAVFVTIFRSAFHIRAVGGGVLGYSVMQAFRYGMSRGIFSNEAGMGTTSTISASAVRSIRRRRACWGCAAFLSTPC
jgi:AGCS family alanine or glycine:cation symporter